jgi:hypothetical protein
MAASKIFTQSARAKHRRQIRVLARLDQVCDHVQKLMAVGRWTPRYETFPLYQSPLAEFSKNR